jgi:hypothetical protein
MSDNAFGNFQENELRTGIFRSADVTVWAASTAYVVGDKVVPLTGTPDGNVYLCTAAGTSDLVEPTWVTAFGSTTSETGASTVQWVTCQIGTLKTPLQMALFDDSQTITSILDGLGTEVTGTSYARVSVNPDDAVWTADAIDGTTANASDIVFPTAGSNDWTTARAVVLLNPNDEVVFAGQLNSDRVIGDAETFKINAGDLVINID